MSLAADTRRAIRARPFLHDALRADLLNVTATARFLDVDGDPEAIAGALRRYRDDLPAYDTDDRAVRVRMQQGIGSVESAADALVTCGATMLGPDAGDATAILASGAVDGLALATVLDHLSLADVAVQAAALGTDQLCVVVDQFDGATALRTVERALERVPER
jgi:hypothetical protein